MAKKGESLTIKQRRFVEEYAADGNATQAYFRAFGRRTSKGTPRSYDGANQSAIALLQNPLIQSELATAQAAYAAKVRVSKQRVIREVTALAMSDFADLFEEDPHTGMPKSKRWGDVPPAMKKAIQSIKIKKRVLKQPEQNEGILEEIEEVEYKLHPKGAELDKLCKKLGFYAVEGQAGGTGAAEVTTFRIPDNGRGDVTPPAAGAEDAHD